MFPIDSANKLLVLATAALIKVYQAAQAVLAQVRPHAFYFGRSNNSRQRHQQHDADLTFTLFPATTCLSLVKTMERFLISTFRADPRLRNDASDSRGDVGDGPQEIYMSVWL